jgi:DNA (cytosine-5)-methyltransferase 1
VRYLSVCSGIEAATVAWHPLGWEAAAFAEIEAFPAAVLAHHYPAVPNYGDMTKHKEWDLGAIDLLVGGTPCQSFSVAGLRKGLDDPRGNLMLTYLAIADQRRPRWLVWENVPGVLSSNGGKDFGTFLGALAELGYGFAYRVLDAQFFGVAQRRRRVFVVGYLGDWRPAAAVLFERESLRGDTAPSRKAGQKFAADFVPSVAGSLDTQCGGGKLTHQSVANGHLIGTITARMFNSLGARDVEEGAVLAVAQPAYALQGAGHTSQNSQGSGWNEEVSFTLNRLDVHGVAQPMAFAQNTRDEVRYINGDGAIAGALAAESGMKQTNYAHQAMAVRRLTPVECERLQGFPDNYTNIPWRKQPIAPDGPRYKALGNSMAVPVMHWIGRRISVYEDVMGET